MVDNYIKVSVRCAPKRPYNKESGSFGVESWTYEFEANDEASRDVALADANEKAVELVKRKLMPTISAWRNTNGISLPAIGFSMGRAQA